MTFDSLCKVIRSEKFIEGDLGGIIIVLKVPLKIVESLMEAIQGQEIKDGDALIGLLFRKESNDVLGSS